MKRIVLIFGLVGIASMVGLATCGHAAPVAPLLSASRLSFSVGLDRSFYQGDHARPPLDKGEWEGAALGAYGLTKHFALAGSARYGFDSQVLQYRLGVRLNLGTD